MWSAEEGVKELRLGIERLRSDSWCLMGRECKGLLLLDEEWISDRELRYAAEISKYQETGIPCVNPLVLVLLDVCGWWRSQVPLLNGGEVLQGHSNTHRHHNRRIC